MDQNTQYRYPGVRPFLGLERQLFFGRFDDVEALTHLIHQERLIVLFAPSGIGKSSLLNAGVVPILTGESNYKVLAIRLGLHQGENGLDFRSKIKDGLPIKEEVSFFNLLVEDDTSLWGHFKKFQASANGQAKFVLIFDQFEELFSYPEVDVEDFHLQLGELLNSEIPQKFRDAIEKKSNTLEDDELALLHQSLEIKLVFTIRSDRLSELDRLSLKLPDILRNRYGLKAFTREQAEDAILNPAYLSKKENGLISPPFDYTDEAVDAILDHLSFGNEGGIEPFQLQVICQFAERLALRKGLKIISSDDLGDLSQIFAQHYDSQIAELSSKADQMSARKLIENGLILETEKRRISLYKGIIERDFGVNTQLLQELVNTHLLRAEPDNRGGFVYELSHDTLVEPILKAKALRIAKEKQLEQLAELARQKKKKEAELAQHKAEILEERMKRLRSRRLAIGGISLAIFAVIALIIAIWQSNLAQQRFEALKESNRRVVIANLAKVNTALENVDFVRASEFLDEAFLFEEEKDKVFKGFVELWYFYMEAEKVQLALRHMNKALSIIEEPVVIPNDSDTLKILREQFSKNVSSDLIAEMKGKYFPSMIRIAGGSYMMGREETDSYADKDELPMHEVSLSDFALSETEVTVSQWALYVASQDIEMPIKPGWGYHGYNPVVNITWYDATKYVKWLNDKLGDNYQLPTEAQWEYAALGGNVESDKKLPYSGGALLDQLGWFKKNSARRTHPVKNKQANALGLYDMSGNVWEWVIDWYSEKYYQECFEKGISNNPKGPQTGIYKVLRGGAWNTGDIYCQSKNRPYITRLPNLPFNNFGMRVAISYN